MSSEPEREANDTLERPPAAKRVQFRLSGLFLLIATFAVIFGIAQWAGLMLAIILCVLPICLIAERVFQDRELIVPPQTRSLRFSRVAVLLICAVGLAAASYFLIFAGAEMIYDFSGGYMWANPYPVLLLFPLFALDSWGDPFHYLAFATPSLVFIILNAPTVWSARAAVPFRQTILLGIATMLSIIWFPWTWPDAIQFSGLTLTVVAIVTNAIFATVLWVMWARIRRRASFGWRIAFGTLLVFWLFSYAFPWLGEMP